MSDPQNPQTPAPIAPAETSSAAEPSSAGPSNPPPASSAATDPAATPSAPQTAAAGPTPAPSASAVLGKILGFTASVLVGIIPTIPVGTITAAATIAEGGLRAIAQWLTTKGSDNALTEAQAEDALQGLLKNLATLTAPLPTPAALENAPASPPAAS